MEEPINAPTAHVYQPLHPALAGARLVPRRDVIVTSHTTRFSMNDYVFYTGFRQCCHRTTDACSAADPRVRDRFPPWDREFFYEKHFKISKLF